MPSPVEALPWGSTSMISTALPQAASAVARLMAVVVLPTPPFWLAMASTRARLRAGAAPGTVRPDGAGPEMVVPELLEPGAALGLGSSFTMDMLQAENVARRVRRAGLAPDLHIPPLP